MNGELWAVEKPWSDEDKETLLSAIRRAVWKVEKGQRVRPHAVNTPQWHRDVTGLPSETFAPSPVSLRHLLLALSRCLRTHFLNSHAKKSRGISRLGQLSRANTWRTLSCLRILAYPPGKKETKITRKKKWQFYGLTGYNNTFAKMHMECQYLPCHMLSRKCASASVLTIF